MAPGQSVDVTLEALPDAKIEQVLVASRGGQASLTSFPATVHLTVPEEEVGDFGVEVTQIGRGHRLAPPIEITLRVVPRAPLQSLKVLPSPAELWIPDTPERVLYVYGQYADGVERDVHQHGAGTKYTSSAPAIVTVSDDGRLQAHGNGEAAVTVTNGSIAVAVPVKVAPAR